jgi:predicted ATP-grasp superfamily ATP-dependent carboligase
MIYCNYKFRIYYRRMWKLLILVTWMIIIHHIVPHFDLYIQ